MARRTHEQTWDRAAPAYGRQEHLELRAVGLALDLLGPSADDRLLDLGTGTGLVLRELARGAARPARATGLDASAGMLARVGPLPDGWELVRGEATRLPWPAASFDAAIVSYLLQVLPRRSRPAALLELHRVLVPGGPLVTVSPWSPRAPARAALTGLASAAPASLGGLRALDPRPDLRRAGFQLERAAFTRGGYPSLVVLARNGLVPRAATTST